MRPQEEELPCGISPRSTLNLTLAAGPCGTTHWHRDHDYFHLAYGVDWNMGHYMGIRSCERHRC